MPVITVEGYLGSGYQNIGRKVARRLNIDFVDRFLLSQVSELTKTKLSDVLELEKPPETVIQKLTKKILIMLERSALTGGGSDPFFGHGVENLLSQPYKDFPHSDAMNENIDFNKSITKVVNSLAKQGSVLILGRGASGILRNNKKTLKIGIFCELELRIKKYAKRNKISVEESRIKIDSYDSAKKNYYLNVFQKEPLDPSMFSLMFNTATLSDSEIIEDICAAAKKYVVKSKDNGKKS
ncbi:MAG: hypothetical protein CL703_01575 [Chloroflexi bacterium]|nr:hypothetical protein [Chloroflexota bacterium]